PEHTGTLITGDYISEKPQVEIIAGAKGVFAIEVFDQDMQGEPGSDRKILDVLTRFKVRFMSKDTNANTITHYVGTTLKHVKRVVKALEEEFPNAEVSTRKVALVSACGSDMKVPGILARSVKALADKEISVLAIHQCMRQVDIQFVIDEDHYNQAIVALHGARIEPHNHECALVAATTACRIARKRHRSRRLRVMEDVLPPDRAPRRPSRLWRVIMAGRGRSPFLPPFSFPSAAVQQPEPGADRQLAEQYHHRQQQSQFQVPGRQCRPERQGVQRISRPPHRVQFIE